MIYGEFKSNRIKAYPKGTAYCPLCNQQLVPKCGEIKIWHWAHKSVIDCDPWKEAETIWHLEWKGHFPSDWLERIMGNHRADVKTFRYVIEFQRCSILTDDIKKRESTFKPMVWVFKIPKDNFEFRKNYGTNKFSFRWKWPRKTVWFCEEQVYLDFDNGYMFKVKKIHKNIPCGGWGELISKEGFIHKVLEENIINK